MLNDIELKEVEKKVFTSYFNDGIWDIYGGLILLGFGLTMLTGSVYLQLAFVTVAMVPLLLKRRIVISRLGLVKFSPQRQAKTKKSLVAAMIVLTATALLGFVFFVLFATDSMPQWLHTWMQNYFLVFFGGMMAVLVAAAAFLVGVKRFYAYAILIFIAFSIAAMLRMADLEGVPVTVAGGLVLLSGIWILVRFLRDNPLPGEETISGRR